MHPKNIAVLARTAAEDKKAENPILLDISKLTSIAHYFLIVHGNSTRQVVAIADHIIDTLKKKKAGIYHTEGLDEGRWVVVDAGSLIVHVFHKEIRDFYGIERLWGEAKVVN